MPVPSRRLKDLIEGTVDHHASQRWPALEEVTIRWRGSYGYLTGYLSENDDDTIALCRIQYLGDPDQWAFAIWQASTDSYAESVLLDGRPAGHPNLALDTACTLYLAGTSDHPVQPDKPLKDLRGAALARRTDPHDNRLFVRPFRRNCEQVVELVHQAAQVRALDHDLAVLPGDRLLRDQRRVRAVRPHGRRGELHLGMVALEPMQPRHRVPAG
jgi:hypothetical protein